MDQQYRDIAADFKQREKYLQDVTYSSYPNSKRTPNYTVDDFDDLTLRTNLQRKSQDYSDKKGKVCSTIHGIYKKNIRL